MGEGIWRRPALAIGAAALVLVAAIAAHARFGDPAASRPAEAKAVSIAAEAAALPAPRRPAFELGYVPALTAGRRGARFAAVLTAGPVRARPSASSAAIARLERRTSLGTTNIVLVVGHTRVDNRLWVRVRFPAARDATGWLPRTRIGGYQYVRTHLHVDRRRLTATLFRDGRPLFRASVGIGNAQFPTPRGSFYVREKLTSFDDPFYGPVAFGTSARSAVLTDWPDGGSIGIHGTNQPDLLPGRVSHGCIRLRNEDILRLNHLMPVGTPVTIT
jgi:lipoprotein-anchoring transpeptidase ErfK/SrfK